LQLVGSFWQRYPQFAFSRELVGVLARYGLECDFDFYGPYQELDTPPNRN
jgi:hypothetical protein